MAAVVVVAAIGLRLVQLGQIPSSLYWDEVAMLVDAKSVAQTGHDLHGRPWFQLLYPSYGDFKLPVYIWLASAAVRLFGVSEWAVRLPSAVAGVLTVVLAGILSYRLWQNAQWHQRPVAGRDHPPAGWVAVATMAVVAVAPWSVMFSRTAFEGHLAQMLVAASMVVWLWPGRRWWQPVGAALLGALATYTYFSVRFVWPVVFISGVGLQSWPLVWRWLQRPQHWSWPRVLAWVGWEMVLPVVVFGLALIPMMRSPLYADSNRFRLGTVSVLQNEAQIIQSNVLRELAGNTPVDRVVFHRYWLTAQQLLKHYADHLDWSFLFIHGDVNLRHGTRQTGLFVWVLLPFFVAGWWWLWRWRPRVVLWMLGWWLVALLPASVPNDTPHALRSLNALVPLAVVLGVGLAGSLWWIREASRKAGHGQVGNGVVWGLVGLICLVHLPYLYHYFRWYDQDAALYWQDGYREVAETIFALRQDKQPVEIVSFDYRFYLWLLAYGPYTGADFHQWPTRNYVLTAFDGINLDALNADTCQNCLLVGKEERIQPLLNELQNVTVQRHLVKGRAKDWAYIVAEVKHE